MCVYIYPFIFWFIPLNYLLLPITLFFFFFFWVKVFVISKYKLLISFSSFQTVSFLTYLLRSFADYIKPHEESICKGIVNLLVTCPDSVFIRKVSSSPFKLYSLFDPFLFCVYNKADRLIQLTGTAGGLETRTWDRFQEGYFPSDWHSVRWKVTFKSNKFLLHNRHLI